MLPLTGMPFALFGHSMGAFLAFELARGLQSCSRPPAALFVSGSPSPTALAEIPQRSSMSDAELVRELEHLGGTPPEVLSNPELLGLVLPVLRADFELTQSYRYVPGEQLRCPVRALGGWLDPEAQPDRLDAWRDMTSGAFAMNLFMGDHFFLVRWEEQIVSLVSNELQRITQRGLS